MLSFYLCLYANYYKVRLQYNRSCVEIIFINYILLQLLVNVQTRLVNDPFNGHQANSEQTCGFCLKAVGCF